MLILLFSIPLIASLVSFISPFVSKRLLKPISVVFSLAPLFLLVFTGSQQIKSQEIIYQWIPSLSIKFHLGIDSLSLLFVYLVSILMPITLMAVQSKNLSFPHVFYGLALLLQGLLLGFFMSRDLVVFA